MVPWCHSGAITFAHALDACRVDPIQRVAASSLVYVSARQRLRFRKARGAAMQMRAEAGHLLLQMRARS